jgi:hypothetical protein
MHTNNKVTIGMDVSDRWSQVAVMDDQGVVVISDRVATKPTSPWWQCRSWRGSGSWRREGGVHRGGQGTCCLPTTTPKPRRTPMERYIGIDVHAASCTLAVVSERGRLLRTMVVETNGEALVDAVRGIAGHRRVVFEEGTQAGWLVELLEPHVHEVVVALVPRSRGQKDDQRDAVGWRRSCGRVASSARCTSTPGSWGQQGQSALEVSTREPA